MSQPTPPSVKTGYQGEVTDQSKRESHLHQWKPAPDPNGNRAERRAAARAKRKTP